MKIKIKTKTKKPKKNELVELEKDLRYYHKVDSLHKWFSLKVITRKEAEKLGYKPCDAGCYNKK